MFCLYYFWARKIYHTIWRFFKILFVSFSKEQKLHNQFGAPLFIVTRDKKKECSSFSALQAGITIPLAKAKIGPPADWKTFDVPLG